MEIWKHNGINDHIIKLIENKQLLCKLIYSVSLINFKIFKDLYQDSLKNLVYLTF